MIPFKFTVTKLLEFVEIKSPHMTLNRRTEHRVGREKLLHVAVVETEVF